MPRREKIGLKTGIRLLKKMMMFGIAFSLILSIGLPIKSAYAGTGPRQMEKLGRGVVAVRDGSHVFISWRLLALDPTGIGFNVYRSTAGGQAVKLNDAVLANGMNFTDTTADLTKDNSYFVKPVIGGHEQAASSSFTLPANPPDAPYFTVPLRDGGSINHVWVGDFDGDGEYDYLVVRETMKPQLIEAYKRDGTLL